MWQLELGLEMRWGRRECVNASRFTKNDFCKAFDKVPPEGTKQSVVVVVVQEGATYADSVTSAGLKCPPPPFQKKINGRE